MSSPPAPGVLSTPLPPGPPLFFLPFSPAPWTEGCPELWELRAADGVEEPSRQRAQPGQWPRDENEHGRFWNSEEEEEAAEAGAQWARGTRGLFPAWKGV